MKSRYKFMTIILIITMITTITMGCRKKEKEEFQQPQVGENPIVDVKEENDEGKKRQDQIKDQQPMNDNIKEDTEANPSIITLENEFGKEVTIPNPEDKLLVMTFWVDWNQKAKSQLEVLENLYPLIKDDVEFVGIHALAFDSISKKEAQEKIKVEGYPYPMLIDEESKAQQKYYVGSFPTTVIIDQDGTVVKSITTVLEEDQLLEEIESILEKFLP